ncbi:MAG: hypothetical protein ACJAXR_000736 [Halopseudomonas sp.]|jgi:hypothetical protein
MTLFIRMGVDEVAKSRGTRDDVTLALDGVHGG